jgi:hypothetical protein
LKRKKGSGAVIGLVPHMHPLPDESKTMQVTLQALVSAYEDTGLGNMKTLMKDMFAEVKNL